MIPNHATLPLHITTQYIPGRLNVTADYLSRDPSQTPEGKEYTMDALAATH